MDFWDLTKLLVRRWKIVSPMLVLSAAFAVLTITQVKPDYVGTAYVQLVPPVIGQTKPGEATAEQRNPWIGLGLETIGNAAIVTVTDRSVAKRMKALGYSDSYTLTMGSTSPMVSFEIIGKSEAQASATAEQLVERFSQSVANLQSAYSVAPSDAITTRRLDLGTNVVQSNSKVKRAFIAVVGAGLLLSAAGTVGIDALLRRRQRRRAAVDAVPPTATPNPAPGTLGAERLSSPSVIAPVPRVHTDERDEVKRPTTMAEEQPTVRVRLDSAPTTSSGKGNSRGESDPSVPPEATIVLPWTRP
ncbi:hypothetical protein GA0070624_4921 [Micromonospora rhizosphaerae]|uniref:Capsular polysaccharide biosynthesis protein n=1 Tax=Micromonospora rhizosphaerae TaxID=568872 RepID=A0A1C6SX92_9ACTN|nr:hypothetical protein [Micromonospora rhizosphaerae]SCL34171.1 hypothetical protein GA0070624_4921 [Micromonospora rhizosphaerae]